MRERSQPAAERREFVRKKTQPFAPLFLEVTEHPVHARHERIGGAARTECGDLLRRRVRVDAVGTDVHHRRLRECGKGLVQAAHHDVRALAHTPVRKSVRETEVRPVRAVHDEDGASLMRGAGDPRDVAHHPLIGGRGDDDRPATRLVQPCGDVFGAHAAQKSPTAHRAGKDVFRADAEFLYRRKNGTVTVARGEHPFSARERERREHRARAPVDGKEGAPAPPQRRKTREDVRKHSLGGVEVVKAGDLGDVTFAERHAEPRELIKITLVPRHVHRDLPVEAGENFKKRLFGHTHLRGHARAFGFFHYNACRRFGQQNRPPLRGAAAFRGARPYRTGREGHSPMILIMMRLGRIPSNSP